MSKSCCFPALFAVLLLANPPSFAAKPCAEEERSVVVTLPDDITVHIVERAIILYDGNKKLHCEDRSIGFINGKFPIGVEINDSPFSYLAKLTLRVKGKSYDLDTTNMYNAWGNRLMDYNAPGAHRSGKHMAAHCYTPNICTLRGVFADAGGAYVAEWQMRYGTSLRSVLSDSSDLINLFLEGGINPPVIE